MLHLLFFNFAFYTIVFAQSEISKDSSNVVFICKSSIKYPREAEENNITGTVIIVYDIDSNCRKINIRIEKGMGYGCDEEALNAIKNCKPIFTSKNRKCVPSLNLKQPFTFRKTRDE